MDLGQRTERSIGRTSRCSPYQDERWPEAAVAQRAVGPDETKTKSFESNAAAAKDTLKIIAEKTAKGYEPVAEEESTEDLVE